LFQLFQPIGGVAASRFGSTPPVPPPLAPAAPPAPPPLAPELPELPELPPPASGDALPGLSFQPEHALSVSHKQPT
jgi:hypothetical protein